MFRLAKSIGLLRTAGTKGKRNGMNLLTILQNIQSGLISPEEAAEKLSFAPFRELADGVTIDQHRAMRTGQGECVLAGQKTPERLAEAVRGLAGEDGKTPVLATRVSPAQAELLQREFPGGEYSAYAGVFSLNKSLHLTPPWPRAGDVMIVTAGSSDMPVALEAFAASTFYGASTGLAPDIGVAGLHRLTPWLESFYKAKVIIVIAGMEGALPSVIAGLTARPVLAVPTSVGYGVSAGGFAALAGMLSSCAPGISVFNIDNGYGAAVFACRLLASFGGEPA